MHAFDAPGLPRRELPDHAEAGGRIPAIAANAEARRDAFARVQAYLAERLGK